MVFFFDNNLSPRIAQILVLLGEDVEHLRSSFGAATPDAEWIAAVAARGRILVTGDRKMRTRRREAELLSACGLTVVFVEPSVLREKRWEQARWFLAHWREIACEAVAAPRGSSFRATKTGRLVRYGQ